MAKLYASSSFKVGKASIEDDRIKSEDLPDIKKDQFPYSSVGWQKMLMMGESYSVDTAVVSTPIESWITSFRLLHIHLDTQKNTFSGQLFHN